LFSELNSRSVADGRWYSHQLFDEFDENAKKDEFFNAHRRPKTTHRSRKISQPRVEKKLNSLNYWQSWEMWLAHFQF